MPPHPGDWQVNKAALSASVSSQTESIRSGLERVAGSQGILTKLQEHFKVRPVHTCSCCLVLKPRGLREMMEAPALNFVDQNI